ncbi:DUF2378 family protein [Pyxidicoccus sp. 3LFB2]
MGTPDTRLIYSVTVQGLFHLALNGRLSPPARNALRDAGLDLDRDLSPAYAITTWLKCLDIVLRDVWPDKARDEAWRLLGHALIEGLTSTMLGRVMVAAARALGPRQSLSQFNRAFRGSDNYVELRLTERSPGVCELWINDILDRPHYYVGILEASMKMMGAPGARVTVLRMEPPSCIFLIEWKV